MNLPLLNYTTSLINEMKLQKDMKNCDLRSAQSDLCELDIVLWNNSLHNYISAVIFSTNLHPTQQHQSVTHIFPFLSFLYSSPLCMPPLINLYEEVFLYL